MKRYLAICVPLSILLTLSLAFPYYRDRIPNGYNVPHPCKANTTWSGVGHENPGGGGTRNPFGLAFAGAGHEWSPGLCQADSDGDGLTNGQELGDPFCTWVPNTTPNRTVNISHPGICDPYNSAACKSKNTFVECDPDSFQSCQAKNNINVKTIDLTFPKTKIPASETNYMCFSFDLPNDQDYHIVANEPVITDINIVHHMLLYGCKNANDIKPSEPVSCSMSTSTNCMSIIGLWTVGLNGSCYGDHVGFRIGKTGYSRVSLQIHYNNPQLMQNYTDSSGLRLYYRPVEAGEEDLGVLLVGQFNLILPPGQSQVKAEGVCPSSCTRQIVVKPVHVISSFNHMHNLGKTMIVSVFRNGTKLKDLSYDPEYNYNSPVEHLQDPEFLLLPGDEIRTTCIYSTLNSSRYVYYGESTTDEMCYGFLTLYPSNALASELCVSFGNLSQCDQYSAEPIDGCDWGQFLNYSNPTSARMFNDVTTNCHLDGFCRPECRVVQNGLKDHPCLKGTANQWITFRLSTTKEGVNFLGRLHSCPATDSGTGQCPTTCGGGKDAAGNLMAKSANLLLILVSIMFFL